MSDRGFLRDENGKLSMMRVHLTWVLVGTMALIWVDTLTRRNAPEAAYSLLGLVLTLLVGSIGGPRIMQHVGGQLGAIMRRLGGGTPPWRPDSTPPPPPEPEVGEADEP